MGPVSVLLGPQAQVLVLQIDYQLVLRDPNQDLQTQHHAYRLLIMQARFKAQYFLATLCLEKLHSNSLTETIILRQCFQSPSHRHRAYTS